MEGLIKCLIDVALGLGDERDQVVAEQDDENNISKGYIQRSHWNQQWKQDAGGDFESSTPSTRRPQKLGRLKNGEEQEVSGFHNWIQFYMEEAKGRVEYQGYIFPRRRGEIPDSDTQLLTIQFEWNGILKSVSSSLIGVSPEFELALYTLCFFAGREDNHVQLGPYFVNVKCYRFGNKIGSVFPIAEI